MVFAFLLAYLRLPLSMIGQLSEPLDFTPSIFVWSFCHVLFEIRSATGRKDIESTKLAMMRKA